MEQFYAELVPTPFNDFVSGAERSDLWRVLVLHKVCISCMKACSTISAEHSECLQ
jgi:hypothetical protein